MNENNYLCKFLEQIKKQTDYIYDEMWVGGRVKKTYILENPPILKTYEKNEDENNDDKTKYINKECDILKTFVDLMNKTEKYDVKLYYENNTINPTFEEDVYSGINAKLACNIYFDTS